MPVINDYPAVPRGTRKEKSSFPYTERHLKCVWFDDMLRPGCLYTQDGNRIVVDNPGRWNLESGPDFLGAALRLQPAGMSRVSISSKKTADADSAVERKISGDVEIHVAASDWQRHGHAGDPAYGRVIAHVTYHPGRLTAGILPEGTLQISLKDALAANPLFAFESIDLTAYPFAAPTRPAPCAAILGQKNAGRVGMLLEAAGRERIRRKSERMASLIKEKGRSQTFYEEIMSALGYKNNRAQFRYLAELLPLEVLREESRMNMLAAYALLMGAGGLLPDRMKARWDEETRSFIRQLWSYWWKYQSRWQERALKRTDWNTKGMRPQNHPRRRMMTAALLFCRPPDPAQELMNIPVDTPKEWINGVMSFLQPAPPFPCYWDFRLSLSGTPRSKRVALIGARRAAAIMSNVVLPFLAASKPDKLNAVLLRKLMPEEDNSIVRQTAYALLGPDHNPSFYRTGLRQQGLIQIFHDYCLNDRSGCRTCPFPEISDRL